MDLFVLQQGRHGHTLVVHNRIQLHVHNYTHMQTHTKQSQVAIYYKIGNTSQNNDPQQGRNSCLWLYHLWFGMTGDAITSSWLNRPKSPFPSLLNTVYSEAGWFLAIFPVIRQTINPLGCDALQSSLMSTTCNNCINRVHSIPLKKPWQCIDQMSRVSAMSLKPNCTLESMLKMAATHSLPVVKSVQYALYTRCKSAANTEQLIHK